MRGATSVVPLLRASRPLWVQQRCKTQQHVKAMLLRRRGKLSGPAPPPNPATPPDATAKTAAATHRDTDASHQPSERDLQAERRREIERCQHQIRTGERRETVEGAVLRLHAMGVTPAYSHTIPAVHKMLLNEGFSPNPRAVATVAYFLLCVPRTALEANASPVVALLRLMRRCCRVLRPNELTRIFHTTAKMHTDEVIDRACTHLSQPRVVATLQPDQVLVVLESLVRLVSRGVAGHPGVARFVPIGLLLLKARSGLLLPGSGAAVGMGGDEEEGVARLRAAGVVSVEPDDSMQCAVPSFVASVLHSLHCLRVYDARYFGFAIALIQSPAPSSPPTQRRGNYLGDVRLPHLLQLSSALAGYLVHLSSASQKGSGGGGGETAQIQQCMAALAKGMLAEELADQPPGVVSQILGDLRASRVLDTAVVEALCLNVCMLGEGEGGEAGQTLPGMPPAGGHGSSRGVSQTMMAELLSRLLWCYRMDPASTQVVSAINHVSFHLMSLCANLTMSQATVGRVCTAYTELAGSRESRINTADTEGSVPLLVVRSEQHRTTFGGRGGGASRPTGRSGGGGGPVQIPGALTALVVQARQIGVTSPMRLFHTTAESLVPILETYVLQGPHDPEYFAALCSVVEWRASKDPGAWAVSPAEAQRLLSALRDLDCGCSLQERLSRGLDAEDVGTVGTEVEPCESSQGLPLVPELFWPAPPPQISCLNAFRDA